MKKKTAVILLILAMAMQLVACGLFTCKQDGCEDDIYKDGYCQYHYYLKQGSDTLKDVVNGIGNLFN